MWYFESITAIFHDFVINKTVSYVTKISALLGIIKITRTLLNKTYPRKNFIYILCVREHSEILIKVLLRKLDLVAKVCVTTII